MINVVTRVTLDPAAIDALNLPGGAIGDGMQRLADRVTERVRANIVSRDLIRTGFMLSDIQNRVWASGTSVTAAIGAPSATYLVYHQGVLWDALMATTPADMAP